MSGDKKSPLVWVIAGEPSGDLIGARLMVALRERTGGYIQIAGIGGEAMRKEGLKSLFPVSDIAVMGLIEIIPRLPLIRKRVRETVSSIIGDAPDVVVSIDAPGFNYEIWKRLRTKRIPLVHYVAPTVWAWRPDRAKKFAAEINHLMALLPFEPPFFEKEGLNTTFVGHPVIEAGFEVGEGKAFRLANQIDMETKIVAVLAGSRRSEVLKLLSVFKKASEDIISCHPDTVFVFPTISFLSNLIQRAVESWPGRTIIVDRSGSKHDVFAAADVAMAASGTVSLELARAQVPHVIAYRMNSLTVSLAKKLHGLDQKFVNLINILLDREVVPEFIQAKCRSDLIAAEVIKLMEGGAALELQRLGVKEALNALRPPNGSPSGTAADVVLSVLHAYRQSER